MALVWHRMATCSARHAVFACANSRSMTHLPQIVRLCMAPKRLSAAQLEQRSAASKKRKEAAAARHVANNAVDADVADADTDALMPDAIGRLASSSMRTTSHLSSRAHATQFSHMLDRLTMHSLPPAAAAAVRL